MRWPCAPVRSIRPWIAPRVITTPARLRALSETCRNRWSSQPGWGVTGYRLAMGGFSFASVVLSYFLVAGGLLTGTLLIGYTHTSSQPLQFAMWAAGSFVGGFFAARASRGSTIVEPAIGAVLLVVTIAAMIGGSDVGKLMWGSGEMTGVGKFIGELAASLAVGAIAGAFVSEKVMGEATTSGIPWILYSALTAFGASMVGTFVATVLFAKGDAATLDTL